MRRFRAVPYIGTKKKSRFMCGGAFRAWRWHRRGYGASERGPTADVARSDAVLERHAGDAAMPRAAIANESVSRRESPVKI